MGRKKKENEKLKKKRNKFNMVSDQNWSFNETFFLSYPFVCVIPFCHAWSWDIAVGDSIVVFLFDFGI